MKNFIIRFTLLLAGLFLLTHAVLPHTHHDGIVCFAHDFCHCTDHCTDQSEHNEEQKHHEEHKHHNHDNCDLKDNVIRQIDSEETQNSYQYKDLLSLCCIGYHLCASHLEPPKLAIHVRQKPYLYTYTSPCLASAKALRAPPFSLLG